MSDRAKLQDLYLVIERVLRNNPTMISILTYEKNLVGNISIYDGEKQVGWIDLGLYPSYGSMDEGIEEMTEDDFDDYEARKKQDVLDSNIEEE